MKTQMCEFPNITASEIMEEKYAVGALTLENPEMKRGMAVLLKAQKALLRPMVDRQIEILKEHGLINE